MLRCPLPIFPATTSSPASEPLVALRLWRPLQALQFTLLNLPHGTAGNLKFSCNGSFADFNHDAGTLDAAGVKDVSRSNGEVVTVTEIENVAQRQGLTLHMETVGPFFRVRVLDLQSKEVLGVAQGVVKPWTSGRILHLDSVRLSPLSLKARKPVFGIAFLLGAAAIRHGYDQKCSKAELLAIKDTDIFHSKLVRYYSRLGFRIVYEVTGESLKDIPHMLIWGGVGSRMDANIEELLKKWSPAFKRL